MQGGPLRHVRAGDRLAIGVTCEQLVRDINGWDVLYRARDTETTDAAQLAVQLKCTVNRLRRVEGGRALSYTLDFGGYNNLRKTPTHPPRLLVVVEVPDDHHIRNVAVPLPEVDQLDRQRMFVSVLRTLAEIEDRHPLLIARDLREASSDLLEFRVIAEPLRHGEMPLRAASELTSGAYGALQAAARAEVARRPHYALGTLPTPVRSFLDSATLAGTEEGSVILRVRPPAPPEPSQPSISGLAAPAPFERRVAERLLEGLRAAKTATHRDLTATDLGALDALDDDIESGLSANLCEALQDLAGTKAGLDARVAVRVRWALTRPADQPATSVEVERGELRRLSEIAAILKQIDPLPNVTVVGPVIRLGREQGDQVGSVVIQADVEGKVRNVHVELERSDYERAMFAHSRDLEVRATGTLERSGQTRELSAPTSFDVAGDPA